MSYFNCQIRFKDSIEIEDVIIKDNHDIIESEDDNIFFYCNSETEIENLMDVNNNEDFIVLSYVKSQPEVKAPSYLFLLREKDDGTRIAVVSAATRSELSQKVTLAINEHFDIETPTVINLNPDDYQMNGGEFVVSVDKDIDEYYSAKILIETITLY